MSYCIVIPHFNHASNFARFLPILREQTSLPIIVVDDGSDDSQQQAIVELLAQHTQCVLLRHGINRGKGAAMITGAHAARAAGHTHMLQLDADGQHDARMIDAFVADSKAHPKALISGAPQFADDAPKARIYGRKVTDFFVAIETLSLNIKDSLCGFRIYPLNEFEQVLDNYHIGRRMDVDTDLMVKSSWHGVDIRFIDTEVVYLENGVSHFHYLSDNLRLIKLHTRLLAGMLIRLPRLIVAKLR